MTAIDRNERILESACYLLLKIQIIAAVCLVYMWAVAIRAIRGLT